MGYNTGTVVVRNDTTKYNFKLSNQNTAGTIIQYTLKDGLVIRPGETTNIHVYANCPYKDFLGSGIKWKMKVYRVSTNECIGTLDCHVSLDKGKTELKEAVTSVDTRFMTKTMFRSAVVEVTESFCDAFIEPRLKHQITFEAERAAARAEGEEMLRIMNKPNCRIM